MTRPPDDSIPAEDELADPDSDDELVALLIKNNLLDDKAEDLGIGSNSKAGIMDQESVIDALWSEHMRAAEKYKSDNLWIWVVVIIVLAFCLLAAAKDGTW